LLTFGPESNPNPQDPVGASQSPNSASSSLTAASVNWVMPPRSYAEARRDSAAGQLHHDPSTITSGTGPLVGGGPSDNSETVRATADGAGAGGGGVGESPDERWMREVRRGHLLRIVRRMADANSCV